MRENKGKDRFSNASITSIGDGVAFYSSGTSTHVWIVRSSNAFIRVITWNEEDIGRIIVERVLEKVRKR